ncbi:uncharacterized protein DUF1672 [Cytobacillus firmus]|uniref:Uncharacterized protein DUF1672 n=2 Tax=Cytobacillus TaxID=2675230 RepID=A0A366K011_CYTFI|nr:MULTISPECIES: DUF1672 family protein [Cytobacillus]RBP94488.1 uncharacterized protein DUF1672 [Cytobacillus firmus]TDX43235.1 uncharacterized protein DUF1672 [Cytobacillus oceanisediminis]
MRMKRVFLLGLIGVSIFLGGCSSLFRDSEEEHIKKVYIRVQDYTGEEYRQPFGKKTDKIAEANRDVIEEATIKYFQETYKTDVKVHNMVGVLKGVKVFVESIGEPHFYTYAYVQIQDNEVLTHLIGAEDYKIQSAIQGGLYHMIFEEEFRKLDDYLESLAEERRVTGITKEALQNAGGLGFMTPYYFINMLSTEAAIKPVYDLYLRDPDASKKELRNAFDKNLFDAENLFINIQLFMSDKGDEPSEEIFNRVTKDLEEMSGIPKATYSFTLNDNLIQKETSVGSKENSLSREFPNEIIRK